MKGALKKISSLSLLAFLAFAPAFAHKFNDPEDKWTTVLSAGFSVPFISSKMQSYSKEAGLDAYGVGLHFEYHGIYNPNGFCLVAKGGAAFTQVLSDGAYEDYEGSAVYLMCGAGRQFAIGRFSLTPALGLGFEYLDMEADYHFDDDRVEDSIEVGMVTLCADLQAAFMFSESFGISLSCLVSLPFFGDGELESHTRGYFDKEDVDVEFRNVNVIPALCFVWRM